MTAPLPTPPEGVPVANRAERLHDAYHAWMAAEDDLIDAVMPGDIVFDFCDVWTDRYDNSVEFHVAEGYGEPPADYVARLWAYGFDRAWFNYEDGTERYYTKDGASSVCVREPGRRRVGPSVPKCPTIKSLIRDRAAPATSAEVWEAARRLASLRMTLWTADDDKRSQDFRDGIERACSDLCEKFAAAIRARARGQA